MCRPHEEVSHVDVVGFDAAPSSWRTGGVRLRLSGFSV